MVPIDGIRSSCYKGAQFAETTRQGELDREWSPKSKILQGIRAERLSGRSVLVRHLDKEMRMVFAATDFSYSVRTSRRAFHALEQRYLLKSMAISWRQI
jgi:hypothetical protein